MSTPHECDDGLCLSPDHRSEDLYQIGGLCDDLDGRRIIEDFLMESVMNNNPLKAEFAKRLASAIIARLAHADPPILLCRLYEVD